MIKCDVCIVGTIVFVAIFPDQTEFSLCAGCTDDLCELQETFFLDVTVIAAGMRQDEDTAYADPMERNL